MNELSKLRWLCRRGMKELDVLLDAYLESAYPIADKQEKEIFLQLLDLQDPELYQLLFKPQASTNKEIKRVAEKIRDAIKA